MISNFGNYEDYDVRDVIETVWIGFCDLSLITSQFSLKQNTVPSTSIYLSIYLILYSSLVE